MQINGLVVCLLLVRGIPRGVSCLLVYQLWNITYSSTIYEMQIENTDLNIKESVYVVCTLSTNLQSTTIKDAQKQCADGRDFRGNVHPFGQIGWSQYAENLHSNLF